MIKTVFAGSSEFGVSSLNFLIKNTNVIGVLTNPDKPAGRGKNLTETLIKKIALQNNIEVYQPQNINTDEAIEKLLSWSPDLIIVVAYGQIIGERLLTIFKDKWFNVHASLLPKYRGAAPIQFALFNGDTITGLTIMKIDKGLDTGDILLKKELNIFDIDNFDSLSEKLSALAPELLAETLKIYQAGEINKKLIKQSDKDAIYTNKITTDLRRLNLFDKKLTIHNRVRGLSLTPGAFINFSGKQLKILETKIIDTSANLFNDIFFQTAQTGELVIAKKNMYLCCSDGFLEILKLQLEGKRIMTAIDFINGQRCQQTKILVG